MTLTDPPSEIHFGYSQKKKKKIEIHALGHWAFGSFALGNELPSLHIKTI